MKKIITLLLFLASYASFKASTFTSRASGLWGVATTWTVTGTVDADGIPDGDDDVTVLTGHNISLNVAVCLTRNFTVNTGATITCNSKKLQLSGNFVNNGNFTGTLQIVMNVLNGTFHSPSALSNTGNIYFNKSATILAGTVINRIGGIFVQYNNTTVTNNGSVSVRGATGYLLLTSNTNMKWINAAGSSLSVEAGIYKNASSALTATAVSNSVTYAGNNASAFITTDYNNLTITANTVKNLTGNLNVTGNLTISGTSNNIFNTNGFNINLGGNLVTSGAVLNFASAGKIVFNGSGTQTVSGTSNTQFYDMEINKTPTSASVVFNSLKYVTHELNMISGNCNANNFLTLTSNASTTARLAAITNTANVSFTGNMIIQKYCPAFSDDGDGSSSVVSYRKFYHDFSSPVSNTTVNDWDNELYLSGIGDYDGIGGPAGVDGWDYNNTPSMHTYASFTNTFVPVSGSTTTLTPGKGYDILMMDYRDTQKDSSEFYAKVIDTRGIPNYGNVSIPVIRTGSGQGWNLVGNPYASPITFSTSTLMSGGATHADQNIYFYENSNYTAYTRSTTVIPPHQGFYIARKFTAGTGQATATVNLVFTEATKVANYTSNYHRQAPKFDIKLLLSSNTNEFYHENKIKFNDEASVDFDEAFDAFYKESPAHIAPAIFMTDKDGVELTVNNLNDQADDVTISLGIFTPEAGTYAINTSVLSKASYNYAWIENVKTGVKYDANKPVVFEGQELGTNKDYVLRLSKKKQHADVQTLAETNLIVFSTENTINLKSSIDNTISELMIYDMTGKLMLSQSHLTLTSGEITKIDVTNFASGIYIVQTIDEKGKVLSRKLIK